MTIRYYIAIEDATGTVIDLIQNPLAFSYTLGFSKRNILQLNLSGYESVNLPDDAMLRLWRRDVAISDEWRNVGNFIFKTSDRSLSETGRKSLIIYGASPEELVEKAVIAYPAGAAQTRKDTDAAQAIAAFVIENSGAQALMSNGRYVDHVTPLVVPTPSAIGLNWQGSRAGKRLMDVCQDIVNYARQNGYRLDFSVGYNEGAYTLQVGILGVDRTVNGLDPSTGLNGAGNTPVVISPLLENMQRYNDVFARMNEANVIIALGSGQQEDRLSAVAIDTVSRDRSLLAQRETIIHATSETASGLPQRAEAALEERAGKRNFVSNPDPTRLRIFVDYNVGDLVTVEAEDGERFNRQITTADISVNLSGNRVAEQYSLEFDDAPIIVTPPIIPWYLAGGAPMPVAAYQPIGAASLADSYLRIAGTGGNANLDPAVVGSGVAPTWASATGWLHGGVNWLETGIVPQEGWSAFVRFSGITVEGRNQFGVLGVAGARFGVRANNSEKRLFQAGGTFQPNGAVSEGVLGVGGQIAYTNGIAAGTIPAWSTTTTETVLIGAAKNLLAAVAITDGNIQAFAIYSSTLTAPQVAAVSAAMAAL